MTSNTLPFDTLVLASSNKGKLAELQAMLGDQVKILPQSDFIDEDVEETGLTSLRMHCSRPAMQRALRVCQRWPTIPVWRSTHSAARPASTPRATPAVRAIPPITPSCYRHWKTYPPKHAGRSSSVRWHCYATPTTLCRSSAKVSGKAAF